jgi:hypothetical protein
MLMRGDGSALTPSDHSTPTHQEKGQLMRDDNWG